MVKKPRARTKTKEPVATPGWVLVAGLILGTLTLIFLMGLVVVSLFNLQIPCESIFLLNLVVAFGAALSAGFLGGDASAKGSLPLPGGLPPIAVGVGGGVAVLVIMLLLLFALVPQKACAPDTQLTEASIDTFVVLAEIEDAEVRERAYRLICKCEPGPAEIEFVSNLRTSGDAAPEILDAATRLESARSEADVDAIVADLNAAACGGDYDFYFDSGMLRCRNNQAIADATGLSPDRPELVNPTLVVLHTTEGPANSLPISVMLQLSTSSHFFVSRAGAVVQMVPTTMQAVHINSRQEWNGITQINRHSVSIQLIGRSADPFTSEQVAATEGLVQAIQDDLGPVVVIGHGDIDATKSEPGPNFPWTDFCRTLTCGHTA